MNWTKRRNITENDNIDHQIDKANSNVNFDPCNLKDKV